MMSTQTNWFVTAGTLRSAFEEKHREDGTSYWACVEEVGDELEGFIRGLQDGELPSDWRYKTIVQVLDAVIEHSNYSDEWESAAREIAEQLTSAYTSELASWLAECSDRISYSEDEVAEGLLPAESTLFERLEGGQRRCIREMAESVLIALGLL